MLLNNIYLENH